jgi:hypothetical protein
MAFIVAEVIFNRMVDTPFITVILDQGYTMIRIPCMPYQSFPYAAA